MGTTWKAALALVGIFVAGAVFGAMFTLGISRRMQEVQSAPQQRFDEQGLSAYAERLALSEEQRAKIRPIFEAASAEMNDILTESNRAARDEIRFVLRQAEADFRNELTTEQVAKLDELQRGRELFFGELGPRPRGGGSGPGNRGGGIPPGGGGRNGGPPRAGGGRGPGPMTENPEMAPVPETLPDAPAMPPAE